MAKKVMNNVIQSVKQNKSEVKKPGISIKEKNISSNGLMGFDKKQSLDILKMMIRSRIIDNKAMRLLKQAKTFFHIAAEGHEAVQMAIGLHLDPKKDWFFPYYRDLGTVLKGK